MVPNRRRSRGEEVFRAEVFSGLGDLFQTPMVGASEGEVPTEDFHLMLRSE